MNEYQCNCDTHIIHTLTYELYIYICVYTYNGVRRWVIKYKHVMLNIIFFKKLVLSQIID